jgi:teichuronic acid biosynthesis glycosyltransferase TuaG
MISQKLIAVITPAYNGAQFINQAVSTVKGQNLPNVRHYIYDDASTDATVDLLNQLSTDPSIHVEFGKENRGQSFGRNILIDQALADGCEYLAFLDVDDQWDPDHLANSLATLGDNDIVYSHPRYIFEDGSPGAMWGITVPQAFIGKHLYHNNFIWISSVVARAELFRSTKFDSSLDSIEDWDMWLQQFNLGRRFVRKSESSMTYLTKVDGAAAQGHTKQYLFDQKNGRLPQLKLHLACGHDYQPDYINVDFYPVEGVVIDAQFDVAELPYEDNSVDEIRAFHIIEHFDWYQGQKVLEEWYRVLKPGGRLWLETPDFLATCDAFVKGTSDFRILLYGHFFAMPWIPGQTHKFLFTEDQLRCQLGWAKFGQVNRLPPASNYVRPDTYNLFLNVEAFK